MKKMAVLVSLVAFATVLSGCGGLSVEGTFRDSRGGVVYQGKVASGQQTVVGSGGMAFLHVTGCASRDDVIVLPASEMKGCCSGGTTVVIAGGGVAVATVAIWAIVDFVLDRPTGFDFVVGPVFEDTVVSIGDDFFFTLLVGDDTEGEGEPPVEGEGEIPVEGEGECEPLSVSIVSPTEGTNVLAGGVVNLVADVAGNGEVHIVMVSPQGNVHHCTVVAPAQVAHPFTLTSLGSGLFTIRAEDRCCNVVEDSVPVTIVGPEGEPPVEGEGEILAEGEGECPPVEGEGEILAEGEGEGEIAEGENPEGEGEPTVEGEGECPPTEGEGEIPAEGEGEPPTEGEGECPEGEAACFTLEIVSPADGSVVASGTSVVLAADITAPHEVSVVMVSPEGEVYRRTVVPPIRVTHSFTLTLRGSGLFSVRVIDTVTGEVVEKTRAVVVN